MNIITRDEWGADAPESSPTHVAASERDTFMVHYSTGQELGREDTHAWVKQIQEFHMNGNKWNDIGYNFLVDREGNIFEGRGWETQGAHCSGWNTRAIGVCFLGNDDPGVNDLTDEAKAAYVWLYAKASKNAGMKLARRGHRDGKATTCPGNEIYQWVHAGMPVEEPVVETAGTEELVLNIPDGWTVVTDDGEVIFTNEEATSPVKPEEEKPEREDTDEPVKDAPVTDDDGVPNLPRASAFQPGKRHTSFTAMGHEFLRWLGDDISKAGGKYTPGPRYSKYDDENVRKVQKLMGDKPDAAGKEFLGARQWKALFTENPPKKKSEPQEKKTPGPKVDINRVPPRRKFKVGQRDQRFTRMGHRFKAWLGDDISKAGATYTPGRTFSRFDVENVKKVQKLMGDKPDGWFGQEQWERLLNERRPKKPSGGGSDENVPVDGMRITQHFGRDSSGYAAGEHTGIDFGDSGSDAIRSTGSGTTVYAGYSGAWGNRVIVRHSNGRYSWYCHLASFNTHVGERISRGEVIGDMGSTGNSTGKHLHYQESAGGYGYWDYKRPNMINSHGY